MDFSFKVDTSELDQMAVRLATITNRLPSTLARSMTFAARDAEQELKRRTPQFVDRPTRWTLNSTFLKPATTERLEVRFGFKDFAFKGTPAAQYLQPMVAGEPRGPKRFERQLQRTGLIRPGEYLTPTGLSPLRFNAYGNIPGSAITQVISRIGGFGQQGYTANRSNSPRSTSKRRQRDFFIGAPGPYDRAIYARVGTRQRGFVPVFNITSQPRYDKRFPVRSILEQTFSKKFSSIFERLVYAPR
jgi:hypothetical protein